MRKQWSQAEDAYLRTWYPRKGPQHCADHLPNRTRRAVENHAQALGLMSGLPKGYVPLCWAAPRNSKGDAIIAHAARKAREDGVLVRHEKRFVKNVVPEWWADQYARELGERRAANHRTRGWLLTRDLARMTGLQPDTIRRSVQNGHSLGRHLATIEHVLVESPRRHYRWHPQQARMAVNAWRATRNGKAAA